MTTPYYKQNLKLSIPITLSSMGQQLVQMMDTLMVGQLGTVQLAAVSFAFAVTGNAMMVMLGFAMGLTPLVGHNYAVGNRKAITSLVQNSMAVNIVITATLVAVLLGLTPLLGRLGQPPEVVAECRGYYVIVALSFLPMVVFLTFKQWLEGMGNTKAAMVITISANVLNVFLNWVFIFGRLGSPAMGVFGAGLATFISRLLCPIAFYMYIKHDINYKTYPLRLQKSKVVRNSFFRRKLTYMGLPIASQMFIEFFALFGITIMMGWISTAALAAYQVVNTMISTTFLTANGITSAVTVLVSHAWGRGDERELNRHFYTGWKMVLCVMGVFALCFIFFGKYIAMLFSHDSEVIAICVELFVVCGFFQLFDGTQVTGLAGLRGIGDVKKPMLYAVTSYLFVALPLAYVCGFVLKLGTWSILAGFMAGLMCAGLLYHTRFRKTVREHFSVPRPLQRGVGDISL